MLEPPGTMRTPSEAAKARTGYVDLSKNGCFAASMDMSAIAPIRKPSRIPFFTQAFARQPDFVEESGWRAKDRKSTRLNSSHRCISYAVFCLKKKKKNRKHTIRNHRA